MILSFLNEKGGVGKTSLCFNISYYFASKGKKILLIDMDGQRANLSFFAGIKNVESKKSMTDVLLKDVDITECIIPVTDKISIIPGNSDLIEINKNVPVKNMQDAVNKIKNDYDFIFIDVNPTPSRIHILTMAVSNSLIIPMLPDIATLEANKGIIETYSLTKSEINPDLNILGIVFNKFDSRMVLSQQVMEVTEKMATKLNTKIFETKIRNNIDIAKAVGSHTGITTYSPKSNGSLDIKSLTSEILLRI